MCIPARTSESGRWSGNNCQISLSSAVGKCEIRAISAGEKIGNEIKLLNSNYDSAGRLRRNVVVKALPLADGPELRRNNEAIATDDPNPVKAANLKH
jgi:hypothetical protein